MIQIYPSILVPSRNEFERRIHLVEYECEVAHIDILDGNMFPNITWYDAKEAGKIEADLQYELHLMVENPLPVIADWIAHVSQTKRVIIHAEIGATRNLGDILFLINEYKGLEKGLAINPDTLVEKIDYLLPKIDCLLVMGVHPGFSGQKFAGDIVFEKIKDVRKCFPNLPIEIDGGVTEELIDPLIQAGATWICAASLIFNEKNPTQKLQKLQKHVSNIT